MGARGNCKIATAPPAPRPPYDVADRKRLEAVSRHAELFASFMRHLPGAAWMKDSEGRYVWANETGERVFQTPLDELHGKTDEQVFPPEIAAQFKEDDRIALAGGNCLQTVEATPQKDGYRYSVVNKFPIVHDGQPAMIGGIAVDITDYVQAREDKLQAEYALRLAIENSLPAGIAAVDLEGRQSYVNQGFCRMLGWSPEELVGAEPPFVYWPPEEEQAIRQALDATARGEAPAGGFELRLQRRNGERFPALLLTSPLLGSEGAVQGWVASVSDLTERKRMEQALVHQATHDSLTGLPNGVLCEDHLRQSLARARRRDSTVALLRLDLDRFKMINATLGLAVGDSLLQQVAKRLSGCLRESETLTRNGGDKFTVILAEIENPQTASAVARRLIEALREPFGVKGSEVFLTISIGIALFPRDGADIVTLERNADRAMYTAKRQGKNRFQFFTADMSLGAPSRLALETELHRALDRGELSLCYQPQFHLATRRIAGLEALLRWESPKFGRVPSSMLIPMAEETGLIVPIGAWVLHEAARQIRAWIEAGYAPLKMGVNVSAVQFDRGDLTETVARTLAEAGLDAACLDLEVTESVIMGDVTESARQLKDLKALGVSVSLDDFGTGYSSLAYLQQLPIDTLKIDRSFLHSMHSDENTRTLVHAIVTLAHSLRMAATAEGVETKSELELLREMGCDFAQSFFLARPARAAVIEDLLLKQAAIPIAAGHRRYAC